jgi:hypothetical protein
MVQPLLFGLTQDQLPQNVPCICLRRCVFCTWYVASVPMSEHVFTWVLICLIHVLLKEYVEIPHYEHVFAYFSEILMNLHSILSVNTDVFPLFWTMLHSCNHLVICFRLPTYLCFLLPLVVQIFEITFFPFKIPFSNGLQITNSLLCFGFGWFIWKCPRFLILGR